MPVHGSKVDSRCFSLSTRVDAFLSLESVGKAPTVPPDFWKEVSRSPEAVSNYIVCLLAKLIALDSDNGLKPLPEVYRDLVELPVDHSKYKHWAAKPLPSNARASALEMQHAIVNTIGFLCEVYGYSTSVHLRHMYLRWNLARNNIADGSRKASAFEEKVITPFSVAQSRQLLHSPSQSTTPTEEDKEKLVRALVKDCYQNHRRAYFGVLPPSFCRLCTPFHAPDTLSYLRLREHVTRSPALLNVAMQHVLKLLTTKVAQNTDYGDREVLLPLLHLFREFLTMMSHVHPVEAYKSILPFYTWPISHAESARKVLDLIVQEGKVRGMAFRRKMLQEEDVGIKLRSTKIRCQLVHMLVDTSHPLTHGATLYQTFQSRQDRPDQWNLQTLLIRNAFRSVFPSFDLVELEGKLQNMSPDVIKSFCQEALEAMEKGSTLNDSQEAEKFLTAELNQLHQRIVDHAESEEQRDSAVSCSSVDGDHFTEEVLGTFALPSPHISTHSLDNCQYPTVLAKLREILVKAQQSHSPQIPATPPTPLVIDGKISKAERRSAVSYPQRTFSSSSRTSMDSTGSSTMDHEGDETRSPLLNGHGTEELTIDDAETPTTETVLALPRSRDAHVISPDSGHVTSPDPISPEVGQLRGSVSSQQEGEEKERGDEGNGGIETPSTDEGSAGGSLREGSRSPSPCTSDRNSESTETEERTERKAREGKSEENGLTPPSLSAIDAAIDKAFQDSLSLESSGSTGTSDTSSRLSGENQDQSLIDDLAPLKQPRERSRLLFRRATAPCGLNPDRNSFGTSFKRNYTNLAGHSSSVMRSISNPMNSLRVRTRAPSTSISTLNKRPKVSIDGSTLSPLHKPNLKLLKVVLAGNDILVSHAAKAYAYLKCEEANLLGGLEVRFYHVPLSRASSSHELFPENSAGSQGNPYLPEPLSEVFNRGGNDVHIGRFLAHMDSWYERNVMQTIHNLLRLLPPDVPAKPNERALSPLAPEPEERATLIHPSKMLVEAVSNFCREATHCVKVKMFRLKMSLKAEKSHKIEHREMYMLHRMDVQRLSGKKASRQVKTFDANVTMTELTLDNSFIRSDMVQMKEVWSIRACNIPRAGDSGVPNPETECFELTLITAQADGGRFASTKYRPSGEHQHHVYDLVLETRDKPLTVMVDGDSDVLVENVIRLELSPAYLDRSFVLSTLSSGHRNNHRLERQLDFPLMTYWPIDVC